MEGKRLSGSAVQANWCQLVLCFNSLALSPEQIGRQWFNDKCRFSVCLEVSRENSDPVGLA